MKDKEEEKRVLLKLGLPFEFDYEGKVTVPKDFTPKLPSAVDLKEDFAEYHSTYAFQDGVLRSEHHLKIRAKEISKQEFEAYRKFAKAASEDEGRYIELQSGAEAAVGEERNPEADKLYEQGQQAIQRQDLRAALDYFKQTLDIDPSHKGAWAALGSAHLELGEVDEGLEALRKEIELNPSAPYAYKTLGFELMDIHRDEEAVRVWQALRKVDPNDREAPANLGSALLELKRYREALPELEVAAEMNPRSAKVLLMLAYAYLVAGDSDKALAAYQKSAELEPRPETWYTIAYRLAERDRKLPEARRYAEMAVEAAEKETSDMQLDKLEVGQLKLILNLGYFWDALGWVHSRLGNSKLAEAYVGAAWTLLQDPAVGDHLGQIYEKQGKAKEAMHTYALALAGSGKLSDARERLLKLMVSRTRAEVAIGLARAELSQLRTVKLKPIVPKLATAEFFVLLSPGPKVEEVRFISGAEELRGATKDLVSAKFDMPFPDDHKTKILRRGILMCHPGTSGCEFVLYPPDSVQSLN